MLIDSVKALQDCLDACVYELPVLEQPGVSMEEKFNKCQVEIWLNLLVYLCHLILNFGLKNSKFVDV